MAADLCSSEKLESSCKVLATKVFGAHLFLQLSFLQEHIELYSTIYQDIWTSCISGASGLLSNQRILRYYWIKEKKHYSLNTWVKFHPSIFNTPFFLHWWSQGSAGDNYRVKAEWHPGHSSSQGYLETKANNHPHSHTHLLTIESFHFTSHAFFGLW